MSKHTNTLSNRQIVQQPPLLILNKSLSRPSFTDYLGSGFRIRESNNTPRDSVILPRSGVSLLLVYVASIEVTHKPDCINERENDQETKEALLRRVENFHKNHQGAIIVMVSAVFGEEEIELVTFQLFQKLLPRPPLFLIAHGEAQAASHVQLIAKATQREMREIVKERICQVIQKAVTTDISLGLGISMGLSFHDASVLIDTFGSMSAVANLSPDEVHQRTPLDIETANAVFDFINRDTVSL